MLFAWRDHGVGVVEADDRRDRTEDLVPGDLGVGGDVVEHRRLVEVARTLASVPAGGHGRAAVDRATHQLVDRVDRRRR